MNRVARQGWVLVWLILVSGPVQFAIAQPGQDPGPAPEGQRNWIAVVLAIILVLCIGVVSFLSTRRGHLD